MPTQLEIYQEQLETARLGAIVTLRRAEVSQDILQYADYALDIIESIESDADKLEQVARGLENVAKLVSKVGFLKPLTVPLRDLIENIRDRAASVEQRAEQIEQKYNNLELAIEAQQAALGVQITVLQDLLGEIDSIKQGVDDATEASVIASLPGIAEDAVIAANNSVSVVDFAAVDAIITAMQNAGNTLENAIDDVLTPAETIVSVFRNVASIVRELDFLRGPLEAVGRVIKPIEWALDAVDFVFNLVVSPVLDPILEALGIRKLFDQFLDAINLPTLTPFNNFDLELADLELHITGPNNLVDQLVDRIDEFRDSLEVQPNGLLRIFSHAPDNDSELVLGEDSLDGSNNAIDALDGDDLLAGGLGNDTLDGGAGDDLLVGGRGDDVLDGGTGRNTAVLLGNFSEFSFTVQDDGDTLIATHTAPAAGRQDQGTDTIRNVEQVAFLDFTVAFTDFGLIQESPSSPTQNALLEGDEGGVPANDFLIGNVGIDTLRGLEGDDYLEGRAGFDSLEGGPGDDWLDGGSGRDFFDGGDGIDTAVFRAGDGSEAGYNRISLLGDPSRQPFTTVETLIDIENLTGDTAREWFWGSDEDNRLDGKAGDDRLNGFGGNDTLLGGDGNDQLVGWSGDDSVLSGQGRDIMIGGLGNDYYQAENRASILWYGGDDNGVEYYFPFWLDPYGSTSLTSDEYAGLQTLGFLPSDFASQLVSSIALDMTTGIVEKFDASGAAIGTDTFSGIGHVVGASGADVMHGSGLGDTLHGGGGDDLLTSADAAEPSNRPNDFRGGQGNDTINPGETNAFLYGEAGDDLFIVDDDGAQLFEGGAGRDTLDFSGSGRAWDVSALNDTAAGWLDGSRDPLNGDREDVLLSEVEDFIGSGFDDIIEGDSGTNLIRGGEGDDTLRAIDESGAIVGDTLYGEAGRDDLYGSFGSDLIDGGEGADTITGGSSFTSVGGNDTYIGGEGDDVFRPLPGGRYLIQGGDGVDELDLNGWSGPLRIARGDSLDDDVTADVIHNGIEIIRGASFGDTLSGTTGPNQYIGEQGNDILNGNEGDDVLYGNAGNDVLDGGGGDDLLFAGTGNNTLRGGNGIDTASWDAAMDGDRFDGTDDWSPRETPGQLEADLMRAQAIFTLEANGTRHPSTLVGIENVIGTSSSDAIRGDAENNTLSGGDGTGNDTLEGRGGDDALTGGEGDDLMIGDNALSDGLALSYINQFGAVTGYLSPDAASYSLPTGGVMTFEVLVQSNTQVAFPHFVSYSAGGSNNEFLLGFGALDALTVAANTSSWQTNITRADIYDGAIHRVSVVLDNTTGFAEIYLDGALRDATVQPGLVAPLSGNGSLIFGQEQDSFGGSFDPSQILDGGIGDIRIFDTVRTQAEIAANWDAPLADPATTPGLVANWQTDLSSGAMIDATGNGPDLAERPNSGAARAAQSGVAGDDFLNGGAGLDTLIGGAGDDRLDGGAGPDVIEGGAGNDTAEYTNSAAWVNLSLLTGFQGGGEGNDAEGDTLSSIENLSGSAFDDRLNGDNDANVLEGRAGADTLDGNGGIDTASYANSSEGVRAVLADPAGNTGDAAGDIYFEIENIRGSDHDDILGGLAAPGVIDGGAGFDIADYGASTGFVNVSLLTGFAGGASGSHAIGDTLIGIEGLAGGALADILSGDNGDNVLAGRAGADTLNGREGSDTADYSESAGWVNVSLLTGFTGGGGGSHATGDVLVSIENVSGSEFDDRLTGSDGDNILRGGLGADTISGNAGSDTLDYRDSDGWVNVSLLTGFTGGGGGSHATGDVIEAMENLLGSEHDDRLTGDDEDNFIRGGDGADTMQGHGGTDTLDYSDSVGWVNVSLLTGFTGGGSNSFATGDVISGFENLIGSDQDDRLNGDNGDNIIVGGAGADTINGYGGIDTVDYADSDSRVTAYMDGRTALFDAGDATGDVLTDIEILRGSAFDDSLFARPGDSTLEGRGGADVLVGTDDVGADWAVYDDSPDWVNVSLLTGFTGGGGGSHATGDFLFRIEHLSGSAFGDRLSGDDADNRLAGLAGADTLDGNGGSDTADYSRSIAAVNVSLLTGFAGGASGSHAIGDVLLDIENLMGSAFDDRLNGDDEDNLLAGLRGADTLDGNGGLDLADYSASGVAVNVSLLTGFAGGASGSHATGDVFVDIEGFLGSDFDDRLNGDNGDNLLIGGAGADTIEGNGGSDTVDYSASAGGVNVSLLTGFAGGDPGSHATGDVLSGIENLTGSALADRLNGDNGANVLIGGAGADTLDGNGGADTVDYSGSAAGVHVAVDTGFTGTATSGDDVGDVFLDIENVTGSSFADTLTGDGSANLLDGGAGADTVDGGAGDDTLIGGSGADDLIGGAGTDLADYSASGGFVNVSLATGFTGGGSGSHSIGDTLAGIENLTGSAFDDLLTGDNGANRLDGGSGGDDSLQGSGGADVFVFSAGFGEDTVGDFEDGLDRLDFSGHGGVGGFGDLSVSTSGGVTTVSDGAGGTLTILGQASSIGADDFIF